MALGESAWSVGGILQLGRAWLTKHWGLAATVWAVLVTLAGTWLLIRRRRRIPKGASLRALLDQADQQSVDAPNQAISIYAGVIAALERKARKRKLAGDDRLALGRAYAGEAAVLAKGGAKDRALLRYEQAMRYLSRLPLATTVTLGSLCASAKDVGEQAKAVYRNLLFAPAEDVTQELALEVEGVLASACYIDPSDPPAEIEDRVAWNTSLASVPHRTPALVILEGQDAGQQHRLVDEVTIGRDIANTIVLRDSAASRRHASIQVLEDGRAVIEDKGSKTGTLVDGRKIDGTTDLQDGATVRCGRTLIGVYLKARPLGRGIAWAHRNLGAASFLQEQWGPAKRALAAALKIDPHDLPARYLLGCVCRKMGDFAAALGHFDETLKRDGNHSDAMYAWAEAAIQSFETGWGPSDPTTRSSQLARAIKYMETIADQRSEDADVQYQLARACDLAGQYVQAVKAARASLRVRDDHMACWVLLARSAEGSGDRELTRSAAQKALTLDNRHVEANFIFGRLCFQDSQYAEAGKHLEWVRGAEEMAGVYRFSASPEFKYMLGRAQYEQGQYISASQLLAEGSAYSREAMFYGGRCHSRTGRYESAARVFYGLLKHHGDETEGRYFLASTLANLDRPDKALQVTAGATVVEAWRDRWQCLEGKVLMKLGRFEEARQRVGQIDPGQPLSVEACVELGRVACMEGKFSEAQGHFESAVAADAGNAEARLWHAKTLAWQGRQAQATESLEAMVGNDAPQDGEFMGDAHYLLGRLKLNEGQIGQARQYFDTARERGCKSDALAFDRATACADGEDWSEAVGELSGLAMRHPEDASVQTNLAAVSCRMAAKHLAASEHGRAVQLFEQAMAGFEQAGAEVPLSEARSALAAACLGRGAQAVIAGGQELADGLAALERARDIDGDDPTIAYVLAAAYFRKRRFDRAMALLEDLCQKHPDDLRARRGLALATEHVGKPSHAEEIWQDLAKSEGLPAEELLRVGLGWAGLCARQKAFKRAADIIYNLLTKKMCPDDLRDELSKLAASYYFIVGDHARAQQIVSQYLEGDAEAYLGAILVQQDRLQEALKALQEAIASKDPNVLELYERVLRALAARRAADDDIDGAHELLKLAKQSLDELAPETVAFMSSLEAVTLLAGTEGEPTASVAAACKKAYAASPQNVTVLRNYAIVSMRLAAAAEDGGLSDKADGHWQEAQRLWQELLDRDEAFWRSYIQACNSGRGRRSRVEETDLPGVLGAIRRRLAGVHAAYACHTIDSGRFKRHLQYAVKYDNSQTQRDALAEEAAKAAQIGLQKAPETHLDFLQAILDVLKPSDRKQYRDLLQSLQIEAAMAALWDERYGDFKRHIKRVGQTAKKSDGDLKEMATAAGRADESLIRKIVRSGKRAVGNNPAVPVEQRQLIVLQLVLNICTAAGSMYISESQIDEIARTLFS